MIRRIFLSTIFFLSILSLFAQDADSSLYKKDYSYGRWMNRGIFDSSLFAPSLPGDPATGNIYYNESSTKFRVKESGVWKDILTGTAGTVSNFSATITGSAMSVAVSNPTSTPHLTMTWLGTTSQQVLGDGTLAARIVNNSQLVNDMLFISANSVNTLTNKSGLISQWTNDAGYVINESDPIFAINGVPKNRTITINGTTLDLSANRSWTISGSGVASFSSGNLSPLFTTTVTNPGTTPALSFALSNAIANSYFGNATGSSTVPSFTAAGALSATSDANVTITLGGNAGSSLLRSASITMGWTGVLPIGRGGTGLSTLGTSNQLLRVNPAGSTLEFWTPNYLSANQTITWTGSGDVTGSASGTTSISPSLTVTGLRNKALPALAAGFLKYDGANFTFDNISTGITSLNGLIVATQTFATGTSGTDFTISSSGTIHTFNFPSASGSARGLLTSTDWTTFNNKQNAISLTTSGTSGNASLVGSTLNIPNYTYTLPTASGSVLGGVKVGGGLSIDGSGVLSASGEVNTASNIGGGLANYDSKSGVDLRFNTFASSDFDLASNLFTIDAALKATWNAKQNAITLTTSGTSGNSSLVGNTLNIPNYTFTVNNNVDNRLLTANGNSNNIDGEVNATFDGAALTLSSSATNPRFALGSSAAFGYSSSTDQFFSGTASGDVVIRNTGGGIFLGNTSSGNPAIKIASDIISIPAGLAAYSSGGFDVVVLNQTSKNLQKTTITPGESNTASNVTATVNTGINAGFFKTKSGVDLQFKPLSTPNLSGVAITGMTNEVEVKDNEWYYKGATSYTSTDNTQHEVTDLTMVIPAGSSGHVVLDVDGISESGEHLGFQKTFYFTKVDATTYTFDGATLFSQSGTTITGLTTSAVTLLDNTSHNLSPFVTGAAATSIYWRIGVREIHIFPNL
jgi:hypothetical protein